MTFPITIPDKTELSMFIDNICRHTAKLTATQVLMQTGKINPMMKLADCYRLTGSRRKVDNAIASGKLKCTKKGVNILVKREHFETWLNKHDFEL